MREPKAKEPPRPPDTDGEAQATSVKVAGCIHPRHPEVQHERHDERNRECERVGHVVYGRGARIAMMVAPQ